MSLDMRQLLIVNESFNFTAERFRDFTYTRQHNTVIKNKQITRQKC